jgi:hypothetical protein
MFSMQDSQQDEISPHLLFLNNREKRHVHMGVAPCCLHIGRCHLDEDLAENIPVAAAFENNVEIFVQQSCPSNICIAHQNKHWLYKSLFHQNTTSLPQAHPD